MNRRLLLTIPVAAAGATLLAGPAAAQQPAPGKDFRLLDPAQPVDDPKRLEVIEFFWYGCPHCYDLQPALHAWLKRKPADVAFRSVPAIFRDSWVAHAQLFYSLEAMGLLDRLHTEVFRAIHEQKTDLSDLARMQAWLGRQNVDTKQFAEVYGSFGVKSRTQRSVQMSRSYGLSGTPSLVVAGRYLTSPAMTQGLERTFAVIDQLIAQLRSGNAPGKR
jgi:thiol:disulfide interchange protein DsbA